MPNQITLHYPTGPITTTKDSLVIDMAKVAEALSEIPDWTPEIERVIDVERNNTMKGFFVDWDGLIRSVNNPGRDLTCVVDGKKIEVLDSDGCVTYEAIYYSSVKEIHAVCDNIPMANVVR